MHSEYDQKSESEWWECIKLRYLLVVYGSEGSMINSYILNGCLTSKTIHQNDLHESHPRKGRLQ